MVTMQTTLHAARMFFRCEAQVCQRRRFRHTPATSPAFHTHSPRPICLPCAPRAYEVERQRYLHHLRVQGRRLTQLWLDSVDSESSLVLVPEEVYVTHPRTPALRGPPRPVCSIFLARHLRRRRRLHRSRLCRRRSRRPRRRRHPCRLLSAAAVSAAAFSAAA
eukprot:7391787-Prymnesium_polylepis.4